MLARFKIDHKGNEAGKVKDIDNFAFKNLEQRGIVERADVEEKPQQNTQPKKSKKK